jgi:hypothetical protein
MKLSNTIRRKTLALPYHFRNKYVFLEGYKPLEEDELKKVDQHFRRDGRRFFPSFSAPKWYRKEQQGQFKVKIKHELSNFQKNPEYEVQIDRKYQHGYWD